MALLDLDTIDVIDALDCWYEIKLEDAEQFKEKPTVNDKGMSASDLTSMGFPIESLIEAANE